MPHNQTAVLARKTPEFNYRFNINKRVLRSGTAANRAILAVSPQISSECPPNNGTQLPPERRTSHPAVGALFTNTRRRRLGAASSSSSLAGQLGNILTQRVYGLPKQCLPSFIYSIPSVLLRSSLRRHRGSRIYFTQRYRANLTRWPPQGKQPYNFMQKKIIKKEREACTSSAFERSARMNCACVLQ